MLSSVKSVEILRDFGLTGNQAKVYIAAARLKLASVNKISKVAKVRREDVYRILPKLEKMGLVEKLLGTPAKIRATPVEEALSLLIKHEEDRARQKVSVLRAKTKTFLKHFAQVPELRMEEANFALLSERESILCKMRTMTKNARRQFDIVCSGIQIMQFVHLFAEELKRTAKKGVRIRIISEPPLYGDSIPKVVEEHVSLGGVPIDLKHTDLSSSHYLIVDFREALVGTAAEGNITDNPCLWTNSESLVGVLQGDFEHLWHNSVGWKTVENETFPGKMIRFMEQMGPTNHVMFVYDSPESKYNVLFNYLKVGLDNGEAAVYVATDEKPSQIREAMKRFGIEVEKYEKKRALHIFGYEDVYNVDGKFSMTAPLSLMNKLCKEALKGGFKGLRASGEMACFFEHDLVQELIEYEKAMHKVLDSPIVGVCAYNAKMLNKSNDPINLYNELARSHGTILFTGIDKELGRMEIRSL